MLSCDVIIWDDNIPLFYFSWKLHSLAFLSIFQTTKNRPLLGPSEPLAAASTHNSAQSNEEFSKPAHSDEGLQMKNFVSEPIPMKNFLRESFFSREAETNRIWSTYHLKVFAGHRKYFWLEETTKMQAGTCRTQENRKKTSQITVLLDYLFYAQKLFLVNVVIIVFKYSIYVNGIVNPMERQLFFGGGGGACAGVIFPNKTVNIKK